ncbi:methyltransferase domain-containing protein [Actinomycetes bacterium KLBMP 9797]
MITYLDRAAASDAGRRYKNDLLAALDVRSGDVVLDVGCGPGTDLGALADAVGTDGTDGTVIGVDIDPAMLDRARRRTADRSTVEIRAGDAHALPLPDASVDRARVDRVLMHLADPPRVLAELRRVVRPGGRVALAEPDWHTLVIDDVDTATSTAYTDYVTTAVVRNAAIGRRLGRLLADAGFAPSVRATAVGYDDYVTAEAVLRMPAVAERGWRSGALDEHATRAWLDRLARGPFLAAFTLFTAIGS